MSTTAIIFSKNRPLQLDLLLRSMERHIHGDMITKVLWRCTQSTMLEYATLHQEHPDIELVSEDKFSADLLQMVEGAEHITFAVDDVVFTGGVDVDFATATLDKFPSALGFSLRLGCNTTYCYPASRQQKLPDFDACSGFLAWDWTMGDGDFGYPLEISGSIYRAADILPLLKSCNYSSPNSLEAALHSMRCYQTRHRFLCLPQSVSFGNPANLVQTEYPNRVGKRMEYSPERLAELYRLGWRGDATKYNGFVPNAAHQETEIHMRAM